MAGRFGIEIDLNARGVTAEIDRVVAHVNKQLASLATRSATPAVREEVRQDIEVSVGAAREQLRQQGASQADIARFERDAATALKRYEQAIAAKGRQDHSKDVARAEQVAERATLALANARDRLSKAIPQSLTSADGRVQRATQNLAQARESLAKAEQEAGRNFRSDVRRQQAEARVVSARQRVQTATTELDKAQQYQERIKAAPLALGRADARVEKASQSLASAREALAKAEQNAARSFRSDARRQQAEDRLVRAHERVARTENELAQAESHRSNVLKQIPLGSRFAEDVQKKESDLAAATQRLAAARDRQAKATREVEDSIRALAQLQQVGGRARNLEQAARNPPKPPRPSKPEYDGEVAARARLQRSIDLENERLRYEQLRSNNVGGILDLERETRRLKEQTNSLERVRNRRIRQEEAQVTHGPPSFTQRVQAAIYQRANPDTEKIAQDFPKLGALLTQKFVTTASYAFSGAIIYSFVNGLREGIRAAEELQRVMAVVKDQFEAVGDAGDFSGFREDILAIARESGIAADQVATVGFQMKGAYGDTARAVRETEAAIRASVVTGIEQKELTDSLTGASLAYGLSIEDITDKAIGLEERFGVLSRESLKVFGDLSTVAVQAGLDLSELGALIGGIQQASALPGAAISEGLGRILPAIQGSAEQLLVLYGSKPPLADGLETITQAFRTGDTGEVLLQLIRDYDSLDSSTQKYVTTLLGGRREARFLNAIFNDTSRILEELEGNQDDAGKTSERFSSIQRTLTQSLARLRESLKQIFDDLARAGVFDALTALAGGFEIVVNSIRLFTRSFAEFDDALGNIPGKVLAIAFAMTLLAKAFQAAQIAKTVFAGTTIGKAITQAAQQATVASVAAQATVAQLFIPAGVGPRAATFQGFESATTTAARQGFLSRVGGAAGGFVTGIGAVGFRGEAVTGVGARLAGLGGVAGGIATLGSFTAAIISSQKALESYTDLQNQQEEGEKRVRKQAEQFSLFELSRRQQQIPKTDSGFLSALGGVISLPALAVEKVTGIDLKTERPAASLSAFLTRSQTATEVSQEVVEQKTVEAYKLALEKRIIANTKDNQEFLKTLEESRGGGLVGKAALQELLALPEPQRTELDELLRATADRNHIIETEGAEQILNVQQLSEAFQAGEISYAEFISKSARAAQLLADADNGTPEFHSKVLAVQRQINSTVSQVLTGQISFLDQLAAAVGDSPLDILPRLVEAVQNPLLRPQDRLQLINSYLQKQQQELQRQVRYAPDARTARDLAYQGLPIDPSIRRAIRQTYVQQFVESAAPEGGLQSRIAAIRNAALRGNAEADQEFVRLEEEQRRQADENVVNEDLLRLQTQAVATQDPVAIARLQQRIAEVKLEFANSTLGNETKRLEAAQAIIEADRGFDQAMLSIAQSELALATSARDDDPLSDAQRTVQSARIALDDAVLSGDKSAINGALAQVNEANRGVRDVLRDQADAARELAREQATNDPIRLAEIDLADAADKIQRAGADPSARARALAAQIRANRTMQDAIRDLASSQIELLQVYAEVAGNTIEAADLGVQLAQKNLRDVIEDVKASGGDPKRSSEVNEAKGVLAQAEANARNTRVSESQRQIDVALQLERITVAQAIQQLEALLQIPGLTQEQIDSLLIKIKSLKDDVGRDIQLNTPSEIQLPTIYEVRRLQTAERMSQGYQDYRVVNFQMVNNNATDFQGAIDKFAVEMEKGNLVYGSEPRIY